RPEHVAQEAGPYDLVHQACAPGEGEHDRERRDHPVGRLGGTRLRHRLRCGARPVGAGGGGAGLLAAGHRGAGSPVSPRRPLSSSAKSARHEVCAAERGCRPPRTRVRPSAMAAPVNAFTVDVEDWYQVSDFEAVVDFTRWDSYPSRVVAN